MSASRLTRQVAAFHRAMSVPVLETPQVPSDARVALRAKLVAEECFEFLAALFPNSYEITALAVRTMQAIDASVPRVDLVEAADAMADVMYVVQGSALEFGVNLEPIAESVHVSNMAKTSGPVREDGKKLKPPNWQPPDIAGCLDRQRAGGTESLGAVLRFAEIVEAAGLEDES